MAVTVKELLAQAIAEVTKLTLAEAAEKMKAGDVLLIDVRDPTEVQQSGQIKGRSTFRVECWSSAPSRKAPTTIRSFARTG